MKQRVLIFIILCLVVSSAAAQQPPFVGENLLNKNVHGEEEFIFFKSNKKYTRMKFNDEIEEGEYEWGSNDTGDYVQLFPENFDDWTVESYDRWYYVYEFGVLVLYTDDTVEKVYFPAKWHLLEVEYSATSSLVLEEGREKQFHSQNLFKYYDSDKPSLNDNWISNPEVDTNPAESAMVRGSFKNPPYRQSNPNSSSVTLRGVIVFNGNQTDMVSYTKYGRVKGASFFFSPRGIETFELKDTMKPQVFLFQPANAKVESSLYVDSIYPGSEANTAAMSKLLYFGTRAF